MWAEGPNGTNIAEIYKESVKRNAAFVPGKYFFPKNGQGNETMRLNFTMADEAEIENAIRTIADVINNHMKNN